MTDAVRKMSTTTIMSTKADLEGLRFAGVTMSGFNTLRGCAKR